MSIVFRKVPRAVAKSRQWALIAKLGIAREGSAFTTPTKKRGLLMTCHFDDERSEREKSLFFNGERFLARFQRARNDSHPFAPAAPRDAELAMTRAWQVALSIDLATALPAGKGELTAFSSDV